MYTKGIRTTGGSKILADFIPDHDATVWTRLNRAGAVLLGKLNLHEFAYGITSSNPHHGIVPQSIRARSNSRRLQWRLSRCDRRAQRRRHHRHRHRWIDSHSRRALRMRRAEAHLEPRQPLRRFAAGVHTRSRRPDHAHRSRRRHDAAGNRRRRPQRFHLEPRARARFLRRPRQRNLRHAHRRHSRAQRRTERRRRALVQRRARYSASARRDRRPSDYSVAADGRRHERHHYVGRGAGDS